MKSHLSKIVDFSISKYIIKYFEIVLKWGTVFFIWIHRKNYKDSSGGTLEATFSYQLILDQICLLTKFEPTQPYGVSFEENNFHDQAISKVFECKIF